MALDHASVVKLSRLAREVDLVLRDTSGPDLERLIAVGGSPQGARPKVFVQIIDEVRTATGRFKRFAEQAEVPVRLAKRVADVLARVPR